MERRRQGVRADLRGAGQRRIHPTLQLRTELTLHHSYTPNLAGRLMKGYTDKQMRKGIGGLAKDLQRESERIGTGPA